MGRAGVDGGDGESGEGVCGSGESGAFKAEVVRDMSAENGTEEVSDISGGFSMRRCRREGRDGTAVREDDGGAADGPG